MQLTGNFLATLPALSLSKLPQLYLQTMHCTLEACQNFSACAHLCSELLPAGRRNLGPYQISWDVWQTSIGAYSAWTTQLLHDPHSLPWSHRLLPDSNWGFSEHSRLSWNPAIAVILRDFQRGNSPEWRRLNFLWSEKSPRFCAVLPQEDCLRLLSGKIGGLWLPCLDWTVLCESEPLWFQGFHSKR